MRSPLVGVGSVTGRRIRPSERRRCDHGNKSSEYKKCFHDHSPDSRSPACISFFDGSRRGDDSIVHLTNDIRNDSGVQAFIPGLCSNRAISPIRNRAGFGTDAASRDTLFRLVAAFAPRSTRLVVQRFRLILAANF
jgi:hypothetical protein